MVRYLAMTDKKRKSYIHKGRDLVRHGYMAPGKAGLLLSFENAHPRHFRFRIFRRLFRITVTVTQNKIRFLRFGLSR